MAGASQMSINRVPQTATAAASRIGPSCAATVHKAVLGQAKRGSILLLSTAERARLDGQCRDMLRATEDYSVLETPVAVGMQPRVQILGARPEPEMNLSEYFANQLITCLHGDTRAQFVISALTSRLTNLHSLWV